MSLASMETVKIVQEYKLSKGDTGSPDVQIAILSTRISKLTGHMKIHKHDHHSRRGLLRMVSRRRKLLNFLKRSDLKRYRNLIKRLGLRS